MIVDPINSNTQGLMHDVLEEEGEERWDLLLTAVEFLVKDVQNFLSSGTDNPGDERNRDYIYSLVNLLRSVEDRDLMSVLPVDNGIYLPELCGGFRLEQLDKDAGFKE